MSREERRPDQILLMLSRPIRSPWLFYKQDLMKLNLQLVSFATVKIQKLNGAKVSVNGLYSVEEKDWLIAAEINFSSTTVLRLVDL